MKYLLFLWGFCYSMQAMEEPETEIKKEPKKIDSQKQVSWHDDVKDNEPKDLTHIGSVPKPPSLNSQAAYLDRSILEAPKAQSMKNDRSKEEQVLDKCCPSCWSKDTECCGTICLDGIKNCWACYILAGLPEEFIRICCCNCFFQCILKQDSEIPEGKQEEE